MAKGSKIVQKNNSGTSWLPWLVVTLLLVITWFLYKPSLDNQFTNWDDNFYVLENPWVKKIDLQSITYFFTHSSASNYHPLTMLSLSLDYHLTGKPGKSVLGNDGLDATVFHATSLVFHLLNVLLVFVFIYLVSRKRLIVATVTALLFAIHPMHVESVAWISERKDVLYAFFFVAGLITYVRYLEKKAWWLLLVTGLLFTASLFSKPSAVVFPLILLIIDYFYDRKFTRGVLLEKLPFFILAIIFGMITFAIQGDVAVVGLKSLTLLQRFMFASYALIMYPVKLIIPLQLSAFYPYPGLDAAGNVPLIYYLSPVIVAVSIVLIYYSARFTKVFGFGFLFYFFSILLVLQFLPVGNAIMADRYSYVSSIGVFFIIGWYLDLAFFSKDKILRSIRWLFAVVFLFYVFFLGKTAYTQTKVWQNSETLWTDVISKYPGAEVSYKHRGNYYGSVNNIDNAMKDYLTFLQIKQDDAAVYNNLGNVYTLRGETTEALGAYSKSILLDSLDPKTFLNRAVILAKRKQYPAAIKDFNRALTLNPELMEAYISRSVMFRDMGRYEDAIADFSRVITADPRNENYFMDRGFCYYMLKQYPQALADFEQCIALNPSNGHAYYNISAINNDLKDYRKAYQNALKAKSLNYPVSDSLLETLKRKGG